MTTVRCSKPPLGLVVRRETSGAGRGPWRIRNIFVPYLKITNTIHGPAHAVQVQNSSQITVAPPVPSGISTPWDSPNWSAVVVTSDVSTFGDNSFRSVEAECVVPVALQPYGDSRRTV